MADNKRTCSTPDCERGHFARSWCKMHYQRWKKHGNPEKTLPGGREKGICSFPECAKPYEARGWCAGHLAQAKKGKRPAPLALRDGRSAAEQMGTHGSRDGNGCIRWTRRLSDDGYGLLDEGGSEWRVNRLAWAAVNGPIPEGLEIDHACHVRSCFNVQHLRLATHKQNSENRKGARADSQSGIRGVGKQPNGKFRARVSHNGKNYYLGEFDTADDAGEAVKAKRLELFTHNDLDRDPA